MSGERRSWDSGAIPIGVYPGRYVLWPEGAPPQEEVPHAGETVWVDGDPFTVVTGIPELAMFGEWGLALAASDYLMHASIREISRTPPEPEIKPCPFCEGKPSVVTGQYGARVSCGGGGGRAHEVDVWGDSRIDAIEAWNRRHG